MEAVLSQNIGIQNRLLLELARRDVSVFGIGDVKDIVHAKDSAIRHALMSLTKKGRLERIERGTYMRVPENAGPSMLWSVYSRDVVPHLVDPYYVAFWTAMNYWDMTEQIPYTVFVATTKRKKNLEFGYERYEFVTLSERKFFGSVEMKTNSGSFNMSSREKTIVDGLMHPEYCGGLTEVTKAMWYAQKEVDWQTVLEMAEKVRIDVVLKRLGYLLSVLDIERDISEAVKKRIKKNSYQYLDHTTDKRKDGISGEYGLVLNRTERELLGWMGH